jgi:hypothetical protein
MNRWILNSLWVQFECFAFLLDLKSDPFIDTVFLNSFDHPSLDIRIHQGNFAWNSLAQVDSDDVALKEINVTIVRGSLVLILGRVGSETDALQSERHSPLLLRQAERPRCSMPYSVN